MEKKSVKVFDVCVIAVCVVLAIFALKWDAEHPKPQGVYGIPAEYVEKRPLSRFAIDIIANDSQYVYLLNSYSAKLLVYDQSGVYQHTLSFYEPSVNGAFQIASEGDRLYVRDNGHNVYVFRLGTLEQFIPKNEFHNHEGVNFTQQSREYTLRSDGIYKVSGGENRCIIPLPFENTPLVRVMEAAACCALLAAILIVRHRRK